ncbi:MAG: CHASE2 domain-containing protein [Bacillota bacterium]
MKIKNTYPILLLLFLISLFSYFNTFANTENKLVDRILQSPDQVDTRIIIVGFDDPSLERLGQWPWPRNYHGEVIDRIYQGGALAIGLDVMFPEKARNPEEDIALVESVSKAGNVVIPTYGHFEKFTHAGKVEALELVEPFTELKSSGIRAHINTFPSPDGIVRKALVFYECQGERINSFSWQLFIQYLAALDLEIPKQSELPLDPWNCLYIDFTGEPGDFEHVSYYQVLNGEIPPEYFEGKIVLIGPYAPGIEDYYFTPLAPQSPMYGVEVHANILQNLLYKNFKKEVSDTVNILAIFSLGLTIQYSFRRLSPIKSLGVSVLLIGFYIFIAIYLYSKGLIVGLIYPLLTVALVYLVMLAYRYLEEMLERKRITDVFGRYVAPQVVNEILATGEAGLKLGGTRKEISVLFVDIRGFTPLSEKAQPEEVVFILNEYLNLTAQSIFKYEGTLDKFIGDATMAIFNAPLDVEDHAFKAVQAAWAMKEGSKALETKLLEKFGRTVHFGIGVNTGYAIVGNIGAEMRMDYTAIGDTVNTSARLESNAKPGQILMSQATYDLVKDRVDVISLGEIKVKGKEQGVTVYQLERIR